MITVFRKELKYVMYYHEFARIRKQLSALMQLDVHGGDFGYVVRSLYFDSIYDRDMYETIDGHLKKAKIRLRTYGGDSLVKLELKEKNGTDSLKRSLTLSREEADRMQQRDYGFLLSRPEEVAYKIYLRLMEGSYRPATLIEYNREAYIYPAGDVRFTFDTGVRGTASGWDLFGESPPWTPLIEAGTGVLEIKYTTTLPAFLKDILKTIDRLAVANSKYVQARQIYQFGGDCK